MNIFGFFPPNFALVVHRTRWIRIEWEFTIQFDLLIFVWVSLMREKQRGLRKKLKHKIPTLIQSCYGRPRRDHICCFNFAISNTERNGGCSFCLIGNVANIPYYWWIHQMFSRFCSKLFLSLSSWKSGPKKFFFS